MTVLTTAPSIPKLAGLKEIFDPDLILGLGLCITLDVLLGYVTSVFTPLQGRLFTSFLGGFAYDDILLLGIMIAGTILTTGRLRKIFIYALWFEICIRIAWKAAKLIPFPWL